MPSDTVTVFFTDRPERIAGNMARSRTASKSDPPNADISILEGKKLRQVVTVLDNPELKGDDLTYSVKILQGAAPAKAAGVSVFIDIIGRPLTPVSRRHHQSRQWANCSTGTQKSATNKSSSSWRRQNQRRAPSLNSRLGSMISSTASITNGRTRRLTCRSRRSAANPRVFGCGAFAEATVHLEGRRSVGGWITSICRNQVTTCP
jgi:hypothetical protein